MSKFLVGYAYRGTSWPEAWEIVEAASIREAMSGVATRHGGSGHVLVTYAHLLPGVASPSVWTDGHPARQC